MEYPDGFTSDLARRGICGVLSVAVCAGVSYEVARATLKRVMQDLEIGKRFRGGTYYGQRKEALKRLAVRFVELETPVGSTLQQFVEFHSEIDIMYMVSTRGHVVTVYNGLVMDQGHLSSIYNSKERRKRIVKPVIQITGKGW